MPLPSCKQHLRVEHEFEDDLIAALRDASIEYVESFCGLKLGPVTGLTWSAEGLIAAVLPVVDLVRALRTSHEGGVLAQMTCGPVTGEVDSRRFGVQLLWEVEPWWGLVPS